MTTYKKNTELNGIEITFNTKPSEDIRNTLKKNGFRWHKIKKLWYAKENEKTLNIAEKLASGATITEEVQDFSDWTGEHTDGYMGAIAWNGSKSDKHLYGSDLSKAIRQDLKEHGIKGCTVSCSTYSMGQSLRVKVACTDADFKPFEDWKQTKTIYDFEVYGNIIKNAELINRGKYTYWETDKMTLDEYWEQTDEEKKRILDLNAQRQYDRVKGETLNTYHLEWYDSFTDGFMRKIQLVNSCINSYRYDDSNSMVDYFDTNFYYDIELKYKTNN